MVLPLERLNLDDAFAFLYEKSAYEPITPFKLAIYILIRSITFHSKEASLKQSHLTRLGFLFYTLISSVHLSFLEFCKAIQGPLNRIHPNLYPSFLESLNEYRGSIEILIQKDDLIFQAPPRRRRLTHSFRDREYHGFVTSRSVLGVFIRKLALARASQSVSELKSSHERWLQWLSAKKPSTREDLFGSYNSVFSLSYIRKSSAFERRFVLRTGTLPVDPADLPDGYSHFSVLKIIGICYVKGIERSADEAATLTPRMEDIHLSSSYIKNSFETGKVQDEALMSVTSATKSEEGTESNRDRSVFRYENPACVWFSELGDVGGAKHPVALVSKELLSSARARAFMEKQIHLLHVSPEEAMSSEQLKAACTFIQHNYCDLSLVERKVVQGSLYIRLKEVRHLHGHQHLILMLNAIRNRNPVEAEEALRAFFDWGAIRVNGRDNNGEVRLTACDARPLRYAPLLLARLARLFNQSQRARHLLTEAIQHAHSNRDLVCLRLAIVEEAAIEAEEDLNDQIKQTPETPFSPSQLLSMWTLQSASSNDDFEQENEMYVDEEKDAKAFSKQLRDCAALQNCIILSQKCINPKQVADGLQLCAGADYGGDRSSQTRLINEAARVVAASLKLANGFTEAAVTDSEALLLHNFGDSFCRKYNTEAHVIASVNIIYVHAMNGKFAAAFDLLQQLKSQFSLERNQQCALHWKKCECLISFDRSFLLGNWAEAFRWLEVMDSLAPEEADLRKSVLYFTVGDLRSAFNVIRTRLKAIEKSKDLRLKLRYDMVIAMLYASHGREHVSRRILEKCLELAESHKVDNMAAMITRRLAYVDMLERKYDKALEKISCCEWLINTRCSLLEKAHFALTAYMINKERWKATRTRETDSLRLSYLAAARSLYRCASAPLLEKTVLKMAAYEYNDLGQIDSRDDCALIHAEMDEKYPATMKWEIL
ncbi:unnamed protein product [Enterobius vermicularis]|uniref:Anaphase-promoting complex subunit 5 n=1 Tax=Enterobius vermicularis TaxID=51028 RepID=A0A0N4VBV7_ENTVE|nr:unnamed protein product [Enterobius vermicularis]